MEYLTDQDYEIAESNGISKKLAYHRYYYGGFSKDRAITEPRKFNKGVWSQWKEIAEANGVSRSTFYKRANDLKWGPEKAATLPLGSKLNDQPSRISKEDFDKAEVNGICANTVRFRVYGLNWSVEKAITREVRNVGRRMMK